MAEKNHRRKGEKGGGEAEAIFLLDPPNPTLLKVPAPHALTFPGWT